MAPPDRRGGFDVQLGERVERPLQVGKDLEDHLVGVELREELRDLLLAEGIRKRGVDGLPVGCRTGQRCRD